VSAKKTVPEPSTVSPDGVMPQIAPRELPQTGRARSETYFIAETDGVAVGVTVGGAEREGVAEVVGGGVLDRVAVGVMGGVTETEEVGVTGGVAETEGEIVLELERVSEEVGDRVGVCVFDGVCVCVEAAVPEPVHEPVCVEVCVAVDD
jgi:hypothetical protein